MGSRFSSAGMPSIFVRALNGSVAVPQEGSVSELKQEIEARAGVAADCVRLAYNGHILQDDELLEDLESKITLELNFELVGGGKKRKKKVYTKPIRSRASTRRSSSLCSSTTRWTSPRARSPA